MSVDVMGVQVRHNGMVATVSRRDHAGTWGVFGVGLESGDRVLARRLQDAPLLAQYLVARWATLEAACAAAEKCCDVYARWLRVTTNLDTETLTALDRIAKTADVADVPTPGPAPAGAPSTT